MSKIKTLILFLFLLSDFAFADTPFFRVLQVDPENSNLRVNVLFQDNKGYIWAGTDHGLFRYDGFVFENVDVKKISADDRITAISEDSQGKMLVGFYNGKIVRWEKDHFALLQTQWKSPVRAMIDVKGEALWIATYGEGIFYTTANGWQSVKDIPDPFVYCIVKHPSGTLLAGTDLGLVVIDYKNGKLNHRVIDSQNGLPDNLVRDIYCDEKGKIWLGLQEKGLYEFDLATGGFAKLPNLDNWNYSSVTCLASLQNEFWIGTENSGIVDFEFQGDQRVRNFGKSNGFAYGNINDILRDNEGNVWVAAENKLLLSPGEKIEMTLSDKGVSFDSINAICSDREGMIWFSNHAGLFRYDYTKTGSIKRYLTAPAYCNIHIVSLYEDENGYLWIGTFDNGLYRLEPGSEEIKRYSEAEGLKNANVISINGSENKIWLATLGGVTLCERPADLLEEAKGNYVFRNFTTEDSPGEVFVYCVFIDSRGKIWFGTDGKGLTVYDHGHFINYPDIDNGKGKVVYSITEDQIGNIWFSTLNHGVYRFDGKAFRNFGISSGLREINIFGLTNDRDGNIVVIHQRGIDLIHPVTFEFEFIGKEAGIDGLDCNLNAVTSDYKGNIWIGTQHGLIRYFNYNKFGSHYPQTHISKIYTFMKPGTGLNDSLLAYNQNQVSFEYVGLWYSNPEAVSYRYRLLGFSNKWISTHDRIVTYPNLPPGNYSFEVMSSNNNQFINPSTAHFNFKIEKPLWKRGWFIVLITLLATSGVIWFLRDRDLRFRRMESLKKEKIEYQFETLKSQVNPHFLFNSFNTLISIIEEDKDKAVDYVERLSDYFRHMVQHRDKDTISLAEELLMVNTYYYLQKKRFGENLSVDINVPDEWKTTYKLPPLTLQLLLENAIKHNAVSHETPLSIRITATDRESLIIQNNLNPKAFKDASTGVGLENIVNRFRILSPREIKIQRGEKEFTIEVPLIS